MGMSTDLAPSGYPSRSAVAGLAALRSADQPVLVAGRTAPRDRRASTRSRHALGRPIGGVEPRDLAATVPTDCRGMARSSGYDRHDSRSAAPTRSSAARERGSDVVQSSYQANLVLTRQPVDVWPRGGFRRTRAPPLDDRRRRVCSQLIPSGAQRLKGFLEGFEGAWCAGMTARLSSSGVEGPRGFRELGRPVVEEIWRVHADDGRRWARLRPWGPMPNCAVPTSHPGR